MGVPGLWKVRVSHIFQGAVLKTVAMLHALLQLVAPAAQKRNMLEFSVMEGFEPNRHGQHSLILGVDVRCAFQQTCCQTSLFLTVNCQHLAHAMSECLCT
jgi:hypothetical protein